MIKNLTNEYINIVLFPKMVSVRHQRRKNLQRKKRNILKRYKKSHACCICLYKKKEKNMIETLCCNYNMCTICSKNWLYIKMSCPMCRSNNPLSIEDEKLIFGPKIIDCIKYIKPILYQRPRILEPIQPQRLRLLVSNSTLNNLSTESYDVPTQSYDLIRAAIYGLNQKPLNSSFNRVKKEFEICSLNKITAKEKQNDILLNNKQLKDVSYLFTNPESSLKRFKKLKKKNTYWNAKNNPQMNIIKQRRYIRTM